jgi:hypothetical protein
MIVAQIMVMFDSKAFRHTGAALTDSAFTTLRLIQHPILLSSDTKLFLHVASVRFVCASAFFGAPML